jgi:uncharacterized protein YneF (UPF0154 family)
MGTTTAILSIILALIAGYFIGRSVATYRANQEFLAFRETLKKYGYWPS